MLIETGKTLSNSDLWTWQTDYYDKFGPEVWTQKQLPFSAETKKNGVNATSCRLPY